MISLQSIQTWKVLQAEKGNSARVMLEVSVQPVTCQAEAVVFHEKCEGGGFPVVATEWQCWGLAIRCHFLAFKSYLVSC